MLQVTERAVARTFLALSLFASGCAARAGSTAGPGGAPSAEFDPQAFYARELQPLPKKPVAFEKLSGEAESREAVKVASNDHSYEVTIPIGTESPVQCFVYKGEVDPGGTLHMINGAAAKKVDIRLFRVTDVSLVGDHPLVFLEAQYLTNTAKGQALGELKSMFYQHPVTPLLCLHDELGYNETFRRITKGFAASLKVANKDVNPSRFVEIYVDKVGDQLAGFSWHRVLSDKSGRLTFRARSTTFVPRSESDLMVQDRASTEVWDAEGRLLEAAYADSEDGELTMSVALKKVGPQEYAYKGKTGGKELSGKFKTKTKRGLATDKIKSKLVVSELFSGKSSELKTEEYHASLNPEAPTEVSYKTESGDNRRVRVARGESEAIATADDKGTLEKVEIPIGGTSLSRERILVRGSP